MNHNNIINSLGIPKGNYTRIVLGATTMRLKMSDFDILSKKTYTEKNIQNLAEKVFIGLIDFNLNRHDEYIKLEKLIKDTEFTLDPKIAKERALKALKDNLNK
jgi:hypothetical protein